MWKNLQALSCLSCIYKRCCLNIVYGSESIGDVLHRSPVIGLVLSKSLNTKYIFSKYLHSSHKVLCAVNSNDKTGPSSKQNEPEVNPKKPKKEIKVYITLLGVDNSFSVTTVEEAKKLAERRNLKLVRKIDFDTKTGRAVYQLMTEAQYLKEDMEWNNTETKSSKREKSIKGDKLVSMTSNTTEHDILIKVKMMKKWLVKNFEVRVVITGDPKTCDNVYNIINKEIGAEGRFVQKRTKGSDTRFQILPPKKKTEEKLSSLVNETKNS